MGRGKRQANNLRSVPASARRSAQKNLETNVLVANGTNLLETQVFYGEAPDPTRFRSPQLINHNKPAGCFWTANYIPGKNLWKEYADESLMKTTGNLYKVFFKPGTKVYDIRSKSDLDFLQEEFPLDPLNETHRDSDARQLFSSMRPLFDYEKFAADSRFQGFRVKEEALFSSSWDPEIEGKTFSPFNLWDIESTCWTDWCFEDFKEIK